MQSAGLITQKSERVLNNWQHTKLRTNGFWKRFCRELEIFDVIRVVTKVTGYTLGQLRSRARNKDKVDARQLFVLLCLEHTPHSYVQMGITMNRDHTSMMNLADRERSDAFEKIWAQAAEEIDIIKEKEFGPPVL
jgi:chromosomal replication initiation ATPase DnaA